MSDSWTPPDLEGTVALVAGATRGAGRGIAVELGAAGATVYCTGRSTRTNRSDMDRPETIEGTAERVTAVGGAGVGERAGEAWSTWELAPHYGVVDVDGRQPHWGNFLEALTAEEDGTSD